MKKNNFFDEEYHIGSSLKDAGKICVCQKSKKHIHFLLSGLDLYVNGVSDPESIDLAWTQGTGAGIFKPLTKKDDDAV